MRKESLTRNPSPSVRLNLSASVFLCALCAFALKRNVAASNRMASADSAPRDGKALSPLRTASAVQDGRRRLTRAEHKSVFIGSPPWLIFRP